MRVVVTIWKASKELTTSRISCSNSLEAAAALKSLITAPPSSCFVLSSSLASSWEVDDETEGQRFSNDSLYIFPLRALFDSNHAVYSPSSFWIPTSFFRTKMHSAGLHRSHYVLNRKQKKRKETRGKANSSRNIIIVQADIEAIMSWTDKSLEAEDSLWQVTVSFPCWRGRTRVWLCKVPYHCQMEQHLWYRAWFYN